jgi:cytochrome P450
MLETLHTRGGKGLFVGDHKVLYLLLLQACIKEVLRLYPAIPVFPREAAADDVLASGHPVSKGARS